MRLKYRGFPDSPMTARYYAEAGLVVGEKYDVAEILEVEGHLMARPLGADPWPGPGHRLFGIPPQGFEPTPQPIPILSCGFRFNSHLMDFFGVLLTRPEGIAAVRALEAVDVPDEDEPFDDWAARACEELSPTAAEACFELFQLPVPCDMGVVRQVYLSDEPLPREFAYIGCYLAELARHDVSQSTFEECLGRVLYALELRGFEIGEISIRFWQGTGGGDRLINAPPDGRLIYGTLNEPDEDDLANEED